MSPSTPAPQRPRGKPRSPEDDDEEVIDGLPSVTPEPGRAPDALEPNASLLDPDAFRRLSRSPFSDRSGQSPLISRANSPASILEWGGDDKARPLFLDPDVLGRYSPSPFHGGRASPLSFREYAPASESWKASMDRSVARFWPKNRGVVFVAFSQLFGASMNLAARLLELDGQPMHPIQILFLRMAVTTILSISYMRWKRIPHAPLGAREVRWLLVLRGFSGFFGLFGMWMSMRYLPLADATVLTFLAPSVSGYACHVLLHDPFTRREQVASYIALAGVVLIARPTSLFSSGSRDGVSPTPPVEMPTNGTFIEPALGGDATPSQRLFAISIAMLGVLGASGAFFAIRGIGKRAHPLISMTYFSSWASVVGMTAMSLGPVLDVGQPSLRWGLPHDPRQWLLLLAVGGCGFCAQYFLTAGLGGERSNRATTMTYTSMLFAAVFDRWVFGHGMGVTSLLGCGLIVGSAVWAAVSRKEPRPEDGLGGEEAAVHAMEAVPVLGEVGRAREEEGGRGIAMEQIPGRR